MAKIPDNEQQYETIKWTLFTRFREIDRQILDRQTHRKSSMDRKIFRDPVEKFRDISGKLRDTEDRLSDQIERFNSKTQVSLKSSELNPKSFRVGGGGGRKERMGVRVGIQRGRYRDRKEQERLDRKNKQRIKGELGKRKKIKRRMDIQRRT